MIKARLGIVEPGDGRVGEYVHTDPCGELSLRLAYATCLQGAGERLHQGRRFRQLALVQRGFNAELGYAALEPFAELAAEGRSRVPVAHTFPLEDWREAMDVSLSGRAHGKLVLLASV